MVDGWNTYKPFFVPLKAFPFEFLDGNNNATAWSCGTKCMFIDPSFEDTSKSSLAKKRFRPEVSCSIL